MRLNLSVLVFLAIATLLQTAQAQRELTGQDLLAEYERLIPINRMLSAGHSIEGPEYPKDLGTLNSTRVEEVYWCGDICPQYGSINIAFSKISEADCSAIGEPVYTNFWERQYAGCTPLVTARGTLVDKGFSWALGYREGKGGKKPSLETPLLFDTSSRCEKNGKKLDCNDLRQGKTVSIKANTHWNLAPGGEADNRTG